MTRPIPRPDAGQPLPVMLRLLDVVAMTQISESTLMTAVMAGECPAVTLAEARRRAAEARALASEGIDPAARRRQDAEARRAEERTHALRPTLGDFWLREYRPMRL